MVNKRNWQLSFTQDESRDASLIIDVEVDGVKRTTENEFGSDRLREPLRLLTEEELEELWSDVLSMCALIKDMLKDGDFAEQRGLF